MYDWLRSHLPFIEVSNTWLESVPSVPKVGSLECNVDDSQFYLSFPVRDATLAADQLTEDLRNIAAWCCKNSLLINPDKTKLLVLGTGPAERIFKWGG